MIRISVSAALLAALSVFTPTAAARQGPMPSKPSIQRMPDGTFRIGLILIDTKKRELRVPGQVNDVTTLEWVANTEGGMKAYESALTVHTGGVAFNTAMLLLGVDPAHSVVPKMHFDPVSPKGDPVEMWIELDRVPDPRGSSGALAQSGAPGTPVRFRVEQLLLDKRTDQTLPEGPWVYTGSSFRPGITPQDPPRYLSDLDGVLIGFVHSPAPVIENPRAGAVDAFGSVVLNTHLGLKPQQPVTLIVRALDRSPKDPD